MSDQSLELRIRRLHQRHRQAQVRRMLTAGVWSAVLLGMITLGGAMALGFLQR
jgi:hypothetical protein